MSSIGINLDEILVEIEKLAGERPEGFSTRDVAKHYGHTVRWAQEKLRALIENDRVVFAGRKQVTRMDGVVGYLPVYRLVVEE